MSETNFPTLFSDEEFETKISELVEPTKKHRHELSDAENLTTSLAAISKSFPHIFEKITLMWNTPELDKWFARLILETKRENGDVRQGFPNHIMNHLLIVYNIHSRTISKEIPNLIDWRKS